MKTTFFICSVVWLFFSSFLLGHTLSAPVWPAVLIILFRFRGSTSLLVLAFLFLLFCWISYSLGLISRFKVSSFCFLIYSLKRAASEKRHIRNHHFETWPYDNAFILLLHLIDCMTRYRILGKKLISLRISNILLHYLLASRLLFRF